MFWPSVTPGYWASAFSELSASFKLSAPIPHGKAANLPAQAAALGISKRGIGFEALDGEPVHIVFLLVAPTDAAGDHLKALAKISRLLKDRFFRQSLRDAKSAEAALKIINDEDEF